jgi:hypothetical protein
MPRNRLAEGAGAFSQVRPSAKGPIDSAKALDALADNGPQSTPATDKFIIRIDLTADAKLKGIEPNPADIITIEATTRKTPATITDQSQDDWKE